MVIFLFTEQIRLSLFFFFDNFFNYTFIPFYGDVAYFFESVFSLNLFIFVWTLFLIDVLPSKSKAKGGECWNMWYDDSENDSECWCDESECHNITCYFIQFLMFVVLFLIPLTLNRVCSACLTMKMLFLAFFYWISSIAVILLLWWQNRQCVCVLFGFEPPFSLFLLFRPSLFFMYGYIEFEMTLFGENDDQCEYKHATLVHRLL